MIIDATELSATDITGMEALIDRCKDGWTIVVGGGENGTWRADAARQAANMRRPNQLIQVSDNVDGFGMSIDQKKSKAEGIAKQSAVKAQKNAAAEAADRQRVADAQAEAAADADAETTVVEPFDE